CEQYDAHLPASRWDYDYARELSDAEAKVRALRAGAPSDALAGFVRLALERRYEAAVAAIPDGVASPIDRAVIAALVTICRIGGRGADADRLAALAAREC